MTFPAGSMALYGAGNWTLRATDQKRLESFEMWYWRRMEKISWTDHVRNEEVLLRVNEQRNILHEKTGARNVVKEIRQYQEKWLQHVQRMDTNRLPKQALQYKPNGRRNIGRPRKRWRDQLHLEVQGTG